MCLAELPVPILKMPFFAWRRHIGGLSRPARDENPTEHACDGEEDGEGLVALATASYLSNPIPPNLTTGYNVYMKGSNYIPPDMFMPRALKNQTIYNITIQNALDANNNMIRLWGGGQFEYDIFYDICDEKGLLIWHDFMFACAMYPGTKEYQDNIRHEIEDNVKRLRNHPSIALWCGNNEVLDLWERGEKLITGWLARIKIEKWYDNIFNQVIPTTVKLEDPDRFLQPTSPSNWEVLP